MKDSIKIFCIVSFMFSFWFVPSSPFLVEWLTTEKGFTPQQVYQDLFPLWSYSQFFIIIGGLFAQYVSFRILFVFGSLLSFASNAFLMWGDSIWYMRGSELTNGAAVGTFSIFVAFIYTVFPQDFHQKITSYTRAAVLIATTASASTGQLTLNITKSAYLALCISLGAGLINCVFSLFQPSNNSNNPNSNASENREFRRVSQSEDPNSPKLPSPNNTVPQAVIINDIEEVTPTGDNSINKIEERSLSSPSTSSSIRRHWHILLGNYNTQVVIWTVWLGMCNAIHMLVLTYWQSVMYQIDPLVNWNGYVSTAAYALAAVTSLIPTRIESLLNKSADYLLIVMPLFYGAFLFLLSIERVIYLAYLWLIAYHCFFEFTLSVGSVQMAKKTGRSKQFGIVFSVNTLVGLLIQNLLQFVVGKQVLNLEPTKQYAVYAYCFFGTAVVCLFLHFCVRNKTPKNVVEHDPLIA